MINIKKRTLKRLRIQNEGEIKMRRINKIGLIISITFLLVITIPIQVTVAEEPDFEEDDILTFGYQETYKRTVDVGNDNEDGYYELDQENNHIEIEDIDTGNKEIEYTYWDRMGEDDRVTISYDSDNTQDQMLFRPVYTFDGDDVLLNYINGPMDTMVGVYFIDPEWDNVNDNLAEALHDWETFVGGEITDMDDFVGDADTFTLMGQSDLDSGLDEFTDTNHKWSGKFVFEGDVHYWDADRYREYDHYELSWEVEFTTGGTLKKATQTKKYSDTGKFSVEYSKLLQNKAVSLGAGGGGLLGGVTHAFEFPIMIFAVVSSIVALRIVGKRKR